jgi:uncharacterized protein (TIGR03083 family)
MTDTSLSPERYFELIDRDTERLALMGERGLEAAVPACPGWIVADVVSHTAMVYEHKVRVLGEGAFPKDWPPPDFESREPIGALRDAKQHLFAEFDRHELTDATTTFGSDTTVRFWLRRMALEVAVHRYDGEQAHDDPTPVPDDLALDGIDEMLRVMLGGPWWNSDEWQTEFPIEGVVAIESGGLRWLCDLRQHSVTISQGDGPASATVAGEPARVFLWLWGRLDDEAVEFTGDRDVAAAFRARIAEVSD